MQLPDVLGNVGLVGNGAFLIWAFLGGVRFVEWVKRVRNGRNGHTDDPVRRVEHLLIEMERRMRDDHRSAMSGVIDEVEKSVELAVRRAVK